MCGAIKNLNTCLGAVTIESCINFEDFAKVSFANGIEIGRVFVLSYLEMQYRCSGNYSGEILKFLESDASKSDLVSLLVSS